MTRREERDLTERFQKIDAAVNKSNAKTVEFTPLEDMIFLQYCCQEGDTTITLLCEKSKFLPVL